MDKTGVFADMLRQVCEKGDDIMFCLALNLVDTIDLERPPVPILLVPLLWE